MPGLAKARPAAVLSYCTAVLLLPLIALSLFWAQYAASARPHIERPDLTGSIWWSAIVAVVLLLVAVMLMIGAGRVQRRRPSGSITLAAACTIATALAICSIVINAATDVWEQPHGQFYAPVAIASRLFPVFPVLPVIALPFAIAVLALLPATRKWCR